MFTDYKLVQAGAECKSSDTRLEDVYSPAQCANLCHALNEVQAGTCKFFMVGNDDLEDRCYVEHTSDSSCPEGWDWDDYDFYEMKGN